MLTGISIRDYIIVDALELDLQAGMTTLTGETGAGKSILLDALGLALGDRADSSRVRRGAKRADIAVRFALADNPDAAAWLAQHDLDHDGELVLRRVLHADGGSKGYINARPSPLAAMRELGERLIDIHGQHEHQSLMRRDAQRRLLDAYAGHADLCADVAARFAQWRRTEGRLRELTRQAQQHDAQRALLHYQVDELEQLNLQPGEFAELEAEQRRLANADTLLTITGNTLAQLYDAEDHSTHALLSHAARQLTHAADLDARLHASLEMLNSAIVQVEEAASQLRRRQNDIEPDPASLAAIDQRLARCLELARKHQATPTDLPEIANHRRAELDALNNAETQLETLRDAAAQQRTDYLTAAGALSRSRSQAAQTLSAGVTAAMQTLGLSGGQFQVERLGLDEAAAAGHGLETVRFLVSINPGQPPAALTKIASGGELARISLAIQVVTAAAQATPTCIFDEVDAGIGGGIAEIVGRRLRDLSAHSQVLCITHLPQVAVQGHQQLLVRKQADDDTLATRITPLTAAARIEEIARMLGGVEITRQTRAHAKEMIQQAQRRRDDPPPRAN